MKPERESLFTGDIDWWQKSVLGWTSRTWDLYATGYKRAADLLVSHVMVEGSDQDTVVYPVLFLYRQYLELQLKSIVREGRDLLDWPPSPTERHGLMPLWTECVRIGHKLWPGPMTLDTDLVGRVVAELDRLDPTSTAFRYPIDRAGRPSLPPDLNEIHLPVLATNMERVERFLDGFASGIEEFQEGKWSEEDHGA